ncbi:MAG: class I SAM-dependent methyltransferase, partial [Deltaproteobacteria bacterium]|nr:class I SAM-dependent methyltransferase [Deltaproteobacteria bacterium]
FNPDQYVYFRCGSAACAVLWRHPPHAEGDVPAMCGDNSAALDDADAAKAGGSGGGRILVIGCFNAGLLSELEGMGRDVTGIDTRRGILDTGGLESGRFDRVLLVHSLEHSGDPRRLLAESYRLLKPGGGLFLVTPNVSAASRFLFGRYWFGLNAPRHRIIHSRASLRSLLSSAGYRSIRIRTGTRDAEEYAMRSLDGMRDKWTGLDVAHRIGKEPLPRALGFLFAAVNGMTGRNGDECHASAEKPL